MTGKGVQLKSLQDRQGCKDKMWYICTQVYGTMKDTMVQSAYFKDLKIHPQWDQMGSLFRCALDSIEEVGGTQALQKILLPLDT